MTHRSRLLRQLRSSSASISSEPPLSLVECRDKDMTFAAPLFMMVRFVNRETGEIREQHVFMGDFPMMTERGTFIIHGTERVIVTQLVRSPGAYVMAAKHEREKQVLIANLMPQRGSWLEFEIDKKGAVNVRIDRKRKFPVTVLLRAMGVGSSDDILKLFDESVYIKNTLDRDSTTSEEESLIELFRKQRPGEPPTLDSAKAMLRGLFFDSKRYDLSRVGRHKLNSRLHGHLAPDERPAPDVRVLTAQDIVELIRRLISLPPKLGVPDDAKDYADAAMNLIGSRREDIAAELDEYEHFGNRRLRTVGELVAGQLPHRPHPHGAGDQGAPHHRGSRHDRAGHAGEYPPRGGRPQGVLRLVAAVAVHGSDQLAVRPDAPAPPQRARLGWSHPRARAHRGARRARHPLRPHVPDRDARRPEHRTHRLALVVRHGRRVRLHPRALPQGRQRQGHRGDRLPRCLGGGSLGRRPQDQRRACRHHRTGERAVRLKTGKFLNDQVLARTRGGDEVVSVPPEQVDYMDVNPTQLVSVATALIPFLEHDDANRALMGSNMQRQAVPLLTTEAPFVGTGMEFRAAVDTGDVILAGRPGKVVEVDANHIVVDAGKGGADEYSLVKFTRSNQGTLIHQKPIVDVGEKVDDGTVLADGSSTDQGELALGKNLLVAFMSWEGYNFEDAIILSERLVKDDVLSSVHIEEYEVDARTTKLGDEEITRDIPNRSEESLKDLDERGIVRIGAEVNSGDLLVGKVTPKGETELTAEEKLIRAIFKEKAREVRDTSLKVPHGEGGKVIDVKIFSRENNDELPPSVNQLVRVYVAKKRKIAEGDKLAGRHGNKGVISKIVPEEDMPYLEDGTPVDIILNPLGVPSRMNIGQVLETHLGWAAHSGFQADGTRINGPAFVASPVFDGATLAEIDELLIKSTDDDGASPVKFKVNEKEPAGRRCSGKVWLYDGRTGERFDNKVTIGYMYILKLLHLVDDKIHARSTGPYSLVTQQPLGGKAQFGGQRFGEMEVWALEAYGAAYTLQEMLTIKSDDTVGRVKAYEAIVKGENISKPNIPESFKVLMKEVQSLSLDMQVQSEEGGILEVHEEDDDLPARGRGARHRPVRQPASA